MRRRVGDKWISLMVVGSVGLSSGCVFGGDGGNDDAASGEPSSAEHQLRVPSGDDIGDPDDGCGAASATDHADLAADRVIARCAPGAPKPVPLAQPATLRVGISARTEDLAPVLLADHFDEFAKEDLTVELVELPDSDALYAALGAGEVDVVAGDLDAPFFDLVHDGTGVRLAMGGAIARRANDVTSPQPGLWVRNDRLTEPERFSDLENAHFAIAGGIADAVAAAVTAVVRQDDLSLNEVRIDLAAGAEAAEMLSDGRVSGAWLDEPAWRSVQDNVLFRLVATLPASESIGGIVFSRRLVDHEVDRSVGLAFARAVVRTVNTYLADDYQQDDDVVAALSEATGVSVEDLQATPPWLFDWELRSATTDRLQSTFVQLGAVIYEEEIPERDIVDRTLYRDAVAQVQG